jgi:hypothetical protein
MFNINPADDGITHINVYTKGNTELGRLLSNMAHTPFTYKDRYGTIFQLLNVEQYWYYRKLSPLTTDSRLQRLFSLNGFAAKKLGQEIQKSLNLRAVDSESIECFRYDILHCIQSKIFQNKRLLTLLLNNTLPFKHYYVYNGRVTNLPEYDWLLDGILLIQNYLKRKRTLGEIPMLD